MVKVGFIDYYLHEWHADNYPEMINAASNGEFEVKYCYGRIWDSPHGKNSQEWSELHGIELLGTEEEIIEKSDVLLVLSPDNPEMHEDLCKKALASGKRVYVDKTFAPDKESALRIFENADKHNTPCYSSSALRFAAEYKTVKREGIKNIHSFGPGELEMYSIHQIEPIVSLMGTDAKSVVFTGDTKFPSFVIEFEGDRYAEVNMKGKFGMEIGYADGSVESVNIMENFWECFMEDLVDFFRTGEIKVDHAQTVAVIAIREAVIEAYKTPWVKVDVK